MLEHKLLGEKCCVVKFRQSDVSFVLCTFYKNTLIITYDITLADCGLIQKRMAIYIILVKNR